MSTTQRTPDCNICLDVAKKPVQCPKCQEISCMKCIQTCMLNDISEPHCPNCRYGWTRRFLHENLTRSFLTGPWAIHRRTVLWERDKSYLPEAQIHVERIKQSRQLEKERDPLIARRSELAAELATIDDMLMQLHVNIIQLANGNAVEVGVPDEPRKFIRKCMHSGCNGFLSTAWKCGLCENYTCKECLVVKDSEEHTCVEADLATARLISKDTKPCPKCGEGIYRSEGCSHMFCTSCKTAFNWNTMKIQEGGYIDNPHYFAYAQANGIGQRNPGDPGPCGGLPSYRAVDALLNWQGATDRLHGRNEPPEYKDAYHIRNTLGHLQGYIAERYNSHNQAGDNSQLRVKFLMNELTSDQVKRALLNLERRKERHRAIREVIDTFVTVGSDLFRNYEVRALNAIQKVLPDFTIPERSYRSWWQENKKTAPIIHKIWCAEWKNTAEEFDKLRIYCNTAFVDISKYYTCVVPQLNETYSFITTRFSKDGRATTKKVRDELDSDSDRESVLHEI